MPLTLNVGVTKKIGLPDYGSLGASCKVAVELDQSLIFGDLDGFHQRVRQAYVACAQAVNDELTRHQNLAEPGAPASGSSEQPVANSGSANGNARNGRNGPSSDSSNGGRQSGRGRSPPRLYGFRSGGELVRKCESGRLGFYTTEDLDYCGGPPGGIAAVPLWVEIESGRQGTVRTFSGLRW